MRLVLSLRLHVTASYEKSIFGRHYTKLTTRNVEFYHTVAELARYAGVVTGLDYSSYCSSCRLFR